jgi:general stress protein 26
MTDIKKDDLAQSFWNELERARTGMLGVAEGEDTRFQPMTAHFDGRDGTFYFYARADGAITEMAGGGRSANFTYAAPGADLFACLHGTLGVESNAELRRRFWSEEVGRWFSGGPDSDEVALLRFDADGADIWLPQSSPNASRLGFGSRDRPEDVRTSLPFN